jgi:hypothetical protein
VENRGGHWATPYSDDEDSKPNPCREKKKQNLLR